MTLGHGNCSELPDPPKRDCKQPLFGTVYQSTNVLVNRGVTLWMKNLNNSLHSPGDAHVEACRGGNIFLTDEGFIEYIALRLTT